MDELERRLRAYRPVGPPPELRERVLKTRNRSLWEWLPAAVAAALVITFYGLSANINRELANQFSAAQAARTAAADALAASLGGDTLAREEAERLVWLEEQRQSSEMAVFGDPFR